MDAIRKKMQSLKGETDGLYATIQGFEDATKEAAARADQESVVNTMCTMVRNMKRLPGQP